jgi:hypothetical protein
MAAIASMVLGFLWYGPIFGKMWMKMMGMKMADMKKAQAKGMTMQYGLMFVGSLVMAYVLAHALVFASAYTKTSGISAGLMVGMWNWLGFIAPVTLTSVLWEGKSWNLWLLNNGYYLVSLLTMGAILAMWM